MLSEARDAYDVAIIGAGPAGTTCALALRKSGLRVVLVEKSQFPRDKVCGDAIPARCEKVLYSIDPAFGKSLSEFPQKIDIRGCRVVAPNRVHFDYFFHTPGYCSERLHFDDFLLQLALKESDTEFLDGFNVSKVERREKDWEIQARDGRTIFGKTVIGCDGAQSVLARLLTKRKTPKEHHCAAVRAYYHGIEGLDENKMEIHFLEDHLPGYFWIFPLKDGWANVGFGMLSSRIAKDKIGLRQSLEAIVAEAPGLKDRFKHATLEGGINGFGLPMGSRKVQLSGDGFLLCGDAAALIEPATGEGIGNAMLSGKLAADHIKAAIGAQDLSAERLSQYDKQLYGKLWKDLRRKYLAQKYLGEKRKLMNWLVNQAQKPGPVNWIMRKVF